MMKYWFEILLLIVVALILIGISPLVHRIRSAAQPSIVAASASAEAEHWKRQRILSWNDTGQIAVMSIVQSPHERCFLVTEHYQAISAISLPDCQDWEAR